MFPTFHYFEVLYHSKTVIFFLQVVEHPNCVFELRTRDGKTKQNKANYERINNDTDLPSVHLKGQMMYVEHWDAFIYLASPVLVIISIIFIIYFICCSTRSNYKD